MDNKKKFTIWLLFLITIVLGATAIYIGYTMREQPEITPESSDAQVPVYSCEQGGFIDNFSSTELNLINWLPKTTMPLADSIILTDTGLQLVVTNADVAKDNVSGIQTNGIFSGDFRATTSSITAMTLDQVGGPGAIYSVFLVSSTGDNLFGVSIKAEYVDGEVVESVVGLVNNQEVEPITLDANIPDLSITLEREQNLVSGYLHSELTGDITIFSESTISAVDGHIKHTLRNDEGVQSSSIVLGKFEMSCVTEKLEENACLCEDSIVVQEQCNVALTATCNDDGTCGCQDDIAKPQATIIITSPSPTITGTIAPTIEVTSEPTASVVGDSFVITQEVETTCLDDSDESTAIHSITITNTSNYDIDIDVEVDVDSKVKEIVIDSITSGGVYEPAFNKIKWESLETINVGEKITLSFEMVLSIDGDIEYSNSVSAVEGKGDLVQSTQTFQTKCLPSTALISDTVDQIIIAVCLIISGYMMFVGGVHKITGRVVWNIFGKNMMFKLSPGYAEKIDSNDKEYFERQVSKSLD